MKKLLILLCISLSFNIFANDDLSNFQVLDMRIGDSLLDYMAEDEILDSIEKHKKLNRYSHLKEPNKFIEIYVPRNNYLYEGAFVFIKNTLPTNYSIQGIRGYRDFKEDFDECIKRRNQIVEILTSMFPDARTGSFIKEDEKGIMDKFSLGNSERIIDVSCQDLEESYRLENNYRGGLEFVIRNEEFSKWGLDYK